MAAFDLWELALMSIGLIVPVLAAVCGILCIVYRRLSSWLILVAIGFFGDSFLGIVNRLGWWLLIRNMDLSSSHVVLQLFSLGTMLGYVLAFALLMVGLMMSLPDIQRQMRRLRETSSEMRERLPISEARESWQPRQEGSQDIQR